MGSADFDLRGRLFQGEGAVRGRCAEALAVDIRNRGRGDRSSVGATDRAMDRAMDLGHRRAGQQQGKRKNANFAANAKVHGD